MGNNSPLGAVVGRHSWLWAAAAAVAVLLVLVWISRLANRPLPASRSHRVAASTMRKAAISEVVRVHRRLRSPATTDCVRDARRGAVKWTGDVEQTLHDLAYGIGVMRTVHLVFGQDQEIRAELDRLHVPFDDTFLELEAATATIVSSVKKHQAK